ncbi:MAG TPA: heavy-metal-associated domain-containing protein [Albitalea sp.]|uniref:heavy-metal-associated domain-containing protein n=1 Tax=Piscinibacter sp. TaxID=1903157 RepID=UPI002ED0D33F
MIAFEVHDMTCDHCASAVTQALKGADRNAEVRIDLATHQVRIEAASADAQALADAIRDAGFTPVPVRG